MGALSIGNAEVAAFWLESILFGAFAVLYCIAVKIMLERLANKQKRRTAQLMLATSTTMFVLAIGHMSLDVTRALEAFVGLSGQPGALDVFLATLNNPTHIAKTFLYVTQTMVGDTFVIYRLCIVWGNNIWITVLPICLLIGTCMAGYGACFELTRAPKGQGPFTPNTKPWVAGFFALSLCTNVIATTLIAFRVWRSSYRVRNFRQNASKFGTSRVLETIIQSAAIYSVTLATLLGTYAGNSAALYIALDSLQPIIGIVFTLIIIRVGLGNSKFSDEQTGRSTQERLDEFAMNPVAINVLVTRRDDCADSDCGQYDGSIPEKAGDIEAGNSTVHAPHVIDTKA